MAKRIRIIVDDYDTITSDEYVRDELSEEGTDVGLIEFLARCLHPAGSTA